MAEIIITIKKKKVPNAGAASKPNRGALSRVRGAKRPLKRRKFTQPVSGQFYDLAQIFESGSWITKNVSVLPNVTSPGFFIEIDSISEPQKTDILNGLLSMGVNNLASTYREVKKSNGDAFPLFIFGTDSLENPFVYDSREEYENWTEENGLVLTSEQLAGSFSISSINPSIGGEILFFQRFGFRDHEAESNTKFTNVFDRSADAVSFNPSATDSYFLVPALPVSQGTHQTTVGANQRTILLNLIYRFFPRAKFEEPDAILETTTAEIEAYNRLVSIPPTRTFTYEITPSLDKTFMAGGDFLAENDLSADFVCGYQYFGTTSEIGFHPPNYLPLKAIIKQGNNFFYAWEN